MVAMLLEGTELIRRPYLQLAWIYMLVVIFKSNEILFGGLGYGKLQPHCARMRVTSVSTGCCQAFAHIIICKLIDGKECSTRNRPKEKGLNYCATSAHEAF